MKQIETEFFEMQKIMEENITQTLDIILEAIKQNADLYMLLF